MSSQGILFEQNLHLDLDRTKLSSNIDFARIYTATVTGAVSGSPLCDALVKNAQIPAAIVSNGTACLRNTYFNDYYLRIHLSPINADFGVMLVTTKKSITIFNSFLTSVKITNVTIIGIDEVADGLTSTGLEGLPITLPALTNATLNITADIDLGNKTFDGIYQLTIDILDTDGTTVLDTVIVDIDTSGIRSATFQFSPFKKMRHMLKFKTRLSESWDDEQRASLISAPYEDVEYEYRINKADANAVLLMERTTAGLPTGVPIWADCIRIGVLAKASTEIDVAIKGNSFEAGKEILIWESDDLAEIIKIDTLNYDLGKIILENETNIDFTNAFILPVRLGYANAGRVVQNYSDSLMKVKVKFSITDVHPDLVNDDKLVYHKSRPLITQQNFQSKSREAFNYKFSKLDGAGFGRRYFVDRGYGQQKKTYVWQCNSRAEVDVMNYLLHYAKGKCKSFYVPTFRADFTLAVDINAIDNFIYCENGRMPIDDSLVGRSIYILLNDGTYEAREVSSIINGDNVKLVLDSAMGRAITGAEINMICLLDLMRQISDQSTVTYKDLEDVQCKMKLTGVMDDKA